MSKTVSHVCLIGARNAGKTVFLAGLQVASDPTRASAVSARAAGDTYDRLRELAAGLRLGHWPPATDAVTAYALPVHIETGGGTFTIQLEALDYPGERVKDLEAGRIEKFLPLYESMRQADVLVLLLDPQDLLLPGEQTGVDKLAAMLRAVEDSRSPASGQRRLEAKDVALVLTKADLTPELTSEAAAREFVDRHAGNLIRRMKPFARQVRVFALSATGPVQTSSAGVTTPGPELAPQGYDDLFTWIVTRRRRGVAVRWMRRAIFTAAIAALVGIPIFAVGNYRAEREWAKVSDSEQSVLERIKAGVGSDQVRVQEVVLQLIEAEEKRCKSGIENSKDLESLRKWRTECDALIGVVPEGRRPAFESLKRVAVERSASIAYEEAKRGERLKLEYFLRAYPGDPRCHEIQALLDVLVEQDRLAELAYIKRFDALDRKGLVGRRDEFQKYLDKYQAKKPSVLHTEMAAATAVATKLLTPTEYAIRLIDSGKFDETRLHQVEMKCGGQSLGKSANTTRSKSAAHDRTFTFTWSVGSGLEVLLWVDTSFNLTTAGTWNGGLSAHDFFLLRGRLNLTATNQWRAGFEDGPYVVFDPAGNFSESEIGLFRKYYLSGDGW